MNISTTILEVLQADIVSILQSTPDLEDAFVYTGDEKDLQTKLNRTFSTRTNSSGGKRGLGLYVAPVVVVEAESNLPGPYLSLKCQVLCLENLMVNRGAHGTNITSSKAALIALGSLHLRGIGPVGVYADRNPIVLEKVDDGFQAHLVTVYTRANGLDAPEKPLTVTAVMSEGETPALTLACGTSGAEIRYTTDGSYPSPTATLYATPLTGLEAGTVLRAAAYKAGLNPGDCTEVLIS